MPGNQLTESEYTLQRTVESFGNLLFELEELHSTHTYRVVVHFCELGNSRYLVLRYPNSGALLFEEFSEGWLFDGKV